MSFAALSADAWALARRFWVIVMQSPNESPRAGTLLQAEDAGATYVLAFTSEHKASAAIDSLGVRSQARTAELRGPHPLELVSAVCRLGASGIMVDFEPGERRWAWRRRLVANA